MWTNRLCTKSHPACGVPGAKALRSTSCWFQFQNCCRPEGFSPRNPTGWVTFCAKPSVPRGFQRDRLRLDSEENWDNSWLTWSRKNSELQLLHVRPRPNSDDLRTRSHQEGVHLIIAAIETKKSRRFFYSSNFSVGFV